jgi:hypothetical protein
MPSGVGTATIDFGATPASEASVAVTGQADISATSHAEAWVMAKGAGAALADQQFAAIALRVVCGEPIAGVGFTINAYCLIGYAEGTFEIEWTWSD